MAKVKKSKTPATDMNRAAEVTPRNLVRTFQIANTLKEADFKGRLPMFHADAVLNDAYDTIIEFVPPIGSA